MFGIFTYGKTKVSKVDFKFVLLHQLDLIKEITEAEMDLFLQNNYTLKNKSMITQIEFLKIFQESVQRVKKENRPLWNFDEQAPNTR